MGKSTKKINGNLIEPLGITPKSKGLGLSESNTGNQIIECKKTKCNTKR